MSNPPLATLKRKFDSLMEAIGDLPADVTDETSEAPCTKRIKLSAWDLLATLSRKRISISEINFIEECSQDGGSCADVVVATFVKAGGGGEKERRVAVKKLRFVINGDMTDEKFLRLFVNELRVLDGLSHPNIVEIVGFVEDVTKRIAWLVFPWEDNGNLREFLCSGEWEIPERVSLIFDVAMAIEYLHTRQPPICHGDLKSLNILVNSSNRALITDFGSARVIRPAPEASATPALQPAASTSNNGPESKDLPQLTITTSHTTLTLTGPACSLCWSPPEVLMGESLDLATDIWGLGWIAWEATTDRHPFEELKGEWDITMKIVEGQLPSIRDHTQLSQIYPLCNMMQKCWRPEPKERPSATECCQSLLFMPRAIPAPKSGEESKIRSADLLKAVGNMHRLQSRREEASEALNQGLIIARLAGNQSAVGAILVEMAENDRAQSKYVEAEASYTQALAIYESIGCDVGRANALRGLGHVQRKRFKYVEAEAAYTQALAISESVEDDLGRASTLNGLEDVQRARSNFVEAEASYTQALAIFESGGCGLARANTLRGLGNVQRTRSEYVEAEASYTQALAIYESIGSGLGRANTLRELGHVQRARSKYVEAEASYTQALAIYESIGSGLGRANTLRELGHVQRARSKYVEAEASYTQALAIHESIGSDLGRANALQSLGDVQRERSKDAEAAASYTQALAIYESIGGDLGRVNCSLRLGQIQLSQARYAEAQTFIKDAAIISEQIGYERGKIHSKQLLEEALEAEKLSTEPPFLPQGSPNTSPGPLSS